MADQIHYRDAEPGDLDEIFAMTEELAEYEKLSDALTATRDDFAAHLFGPTAAAKVILAEYNGAVAGQAIWFYTFSTFVGRPGIYLEDIFVRPAFRGRGIGRGFFDRLARQAVAEGCGRIEWAVLNWNAPSIAFYRGLGAAALDEWTGYRLDGPALAALGGGN